MGVTNGRICDEDGRNDNDDEDGPSRGIVLMSMCVDACVYTRRRIGVGSDGVEDRGGNGGGGGGTAALSRDINQDYRSMAMVLILSQ